jgi:hypothetical protein
VRINGFSMAGKAQDAHYEKRVDGTTDGTHAHRISVHCCDCLKAFYYTRREDCTGQAQFRPVRCAECASRLWAKRLATH